MYYAKKLELVEVDPKFFEQLKVDREYEHIQWPAPGVTKTSFSLDITRILNDQTIPDDEKVKLYANAFRRYVNIRNELPVVQNEPPLPPPPAPPPPSPWLSSSLPPPRLFTVEQASPEKRSRLRKKPAKGEQLRRELPQRIRRRPIK